MVVASRRVGKAARSGVSAVVAAPGTPIESAVRTGWERHFGADLSDVRVHCDARAAASADDLTAHAYTVGRHIVFGANEYAPGTAGGRRTLGHELAHVLQQQPVTATDAGRLPLSSPDSAAERTADRAAQGHPVDLRAAPPAIHRRIWMRGPNAWIVFATWNDLTPSQRRRLLAKFGPADRQLATAVIADMAAAHDEFRFEDLDELHTEVFKRLRTSQLMRETQKVSGPHAKSFGYPRHHPDGSWIAGLGPRVNKAAEPYWGPVQDSTGDYYFELAPLGKAHAFAALTSLFTPQGDPGDRTLIHCDYLASVVHYRAFAESIGAAEFNRRVRDGTIAMTLKWNGFDDIETDWLRSAKGESLQEVRPSSEADLVIGDHVVFWNHRTYDLINEGTFEAWRLENAILVQRTRAGADIFLGHGSGEQTRAGMLRKLVDRYNEVATKALTTIARATSPTPAVRTAGQAELGVRFPNIHPSGTEYHLQGDAHGVHVDRKVVTVTPSDPEMIGLRDPENLAQLNLVKRPKESA
jgi:Domain of unknown function (DUF4157)/Protein-glutamine gamma-glutamyltransferase